MYWINNHYSVNLEYLGAGISSLLLYTWDTCKCLSPNIRVYTNNTYSLGKWFLSSRWCSNGEMSFRTI